MSQVHAYSHNDLDGLSVYFPLKKKFKKTLVTNKFCSYARINDMLRKFLRKFKKGDILFITDISIDEQNIKRLEELHQEGYTIYFIDHHANNLWMNKYEWASVVTEIDGIKTCATTLVVSFLEEHFSYVPDVKMKSYIELVRSYDVWDWKATGNLKAKNLNDLFFLGSFQEFVDNTYAWLTENTDEEFDFSDSVKVLIENENKKIAKYLLAKEKEMRKTTVKERSVGVVYAENYQSELGNYLAENHLDVDFILLINLSSRKASVRSIKEDCDSNLFAAQYGGGGHPQASGFLLTDENVKDLILI